MLCSTRLRVYTPLYCDWILLAARCCCFVAFRTSTKPFPALSFDALELAPDADEAPGTDDDAPEPLTDDEPPVLLDLSVLLVLVPR